MHILAVDDEFWVLEELTGELAKVFPDGEIHGEMDPFQAVDWARELADRGERLDYVFLDVHLRGMDGLELARRIKVIYPDAVLIFCTAYSEYAIDAFGLYAKGYLLKPVSAQSITQVLDQMVTNWREERNGSPSDIRVQTFGHFEVFVNGKPLAFEREKARELLAYLESREVYELTNESEMSPELQELAARTREISRKYEGFQANICLNYGGRDEILRAARAFAQECAEGKAKPEDLTEERLSGGLFSAGVPDPDLVIRPSGELRLSNFLLWQSAYSEFYYSDVLWPDFTKEDLNRAIAAFQQRDRRYGGV